MAENSTRLKMMKLYEILREETDENHPISRQDLLAKVCEAGLPCHPRTITRHIAALNETGYEVVETKVDHEKYYHVPERTFSVPELKIMIDAVQAASFVTEKKSAELISKIAALGGANSAELLTRHMAYFNSRKHSNEAILYTVDGIEDAIQRRKKVAFNYFDLDENKQRVYRCKDTGEKRRYYVEPVALVLSEDNYYLMSYSNRHPETTANYRLDRIDHLEVVEESVLSDEALAKIKGVAEYTEQVFRMYNGAQADVTLAFDRSLIGPVLDKFGEGVEIAANDNGCTATVQVLVSGTFFGWLAQFGPKMKIVSPLPVAEQYKDHIHTILNQNGEDAIS